MLVAALGLFAPTIRWHKGVFYIICTNARRTSGDELRTDNFYVTSTDIWAGRWSDPTWFEFDGIDPSLFFDDNDRAYIQGSHREGSVADQLCTIRQMEFDLNSGKPTSEMRVICGRSGEKSDIEGPHMYKKDGYYYLLVADGGTFEHHKARIGRSKNIWGPFDVNGQGAVLTAENTDEYVQHVGHADLFQDRSGVWWATALGVRNENGRFPMGRETFLIPVDWPVGEWPRFGRAKMNFQRNVPPAPTGKLCCPKSEARTDDVYIRNVDLSNYSFSADGRVVTLVPQSTDLSAPKGTTTFVGRRQRSLNCAAIVTLNVPTGKAVKAGLTLYKDDFRHVDICYNSATGIVALQSAIKLKGTLTIQGEQAVMTETLEMLISSTPLSYDFSIREGHASSWKLLGSVDSLDMTACDFNGTLFGVFASTGEPGQGNPVRFEGFHVS
jgi:beta-xylosidase